MKVVIVGDRLREGNQEDDMELVNGLIDSLKKKYADFQVITASCDRGIGKYLRNRCGPRVEGERSGEVDFTEVVMKIYLRHPSKQALNERWRARNAALVELGEEFHLCPMQYGRSTTTWDLIKRVRKAGLPYAVYAVGEKTPKDAKVWEPGQTSTPVAEAKPAGA